jgi:type I restriction enzyme S subunit
LIFEKANPQSGENLPRGWTWVRIGDIAAKINPGFPSGKHNKEGRGIPHLRPMNISPKGEIDLTETKYVEVSDYDHLREGDILFNNTNSPALLGKTTYIRKDTNWAYSNHMTRIRLLDKIQVEPAWVAYGLHHLFETGFFRMHCRHHVNQASINTTFLTERVSLPLPPLSEQKRIVEKVEELLSQLDAGVAELNRVQANLARYKASVLKAACEGRLVPSEAELARAEERDYETGEELLQRILAERKKKWEEEQRAKGKGPSKMKYKEAEAADIEDLPELPEGWIWATMAQIGELARGKSKHRPRNDPKLYGGDYPFVQTGEIRQAEGIITTYTNTYNDFGLAQSRLWPKGTLCITIAANIADTAILGFDSCFPDSIVGFIGDENVILKFIEYYVRTAKEDLDRYAPATAQKNINLTVLEGLAIPLPPLSEQERIVNELECKLSLVSGLENAIGANLIRSERLRQAILKRAFEGKLVPQDAEDEPASKLLDQIGTQRNFDQISQS